MHIDLCVCFLQARHQRSLIHGLVYTHLKSRLMFLIVSVTIQTLNKVFLLFPLSASLPTVIPVCMGVAVNPISVQL